MMNLHAIVRGCVPAIHPDETVTLVQSSGHVNVKGVITPSFYAAERVLAQVQSLSSDDLVAMEDTARTEHSRRFYLFSDTAAGVIPQGIARPLARDGDLMFRDDGTWWLVTSMLEDFSGAGWVCVKGTLQTEVPDTAASLAARMNEPDTDSNSASNADKDTEDADD